MRQPIDGVLEAAQRVDRGEAEPASGVFRVTPNPPMTVRLNALAQRMRRVVALINVRPTDGRDD